MLYNALILPHLNYCVTAWGYQCNRIIKLQKKAIRTVMISSYNAHTESFFKNLKLLKIQDILTLQTLKIYHKFRNNKLPYYIQNWPQFQNSNIHNHNTRGANALHKNRCLHVFAQKSLKLNISNIVNDICHDMFLILCCRPADYTCNSSNNTLNQHILCSLKSQVVSLQTAHSWANAGVLFGDACIGSGVAFEAI